MLLSLLNGRYWNEFLQSIGIQTLRIKDEKVLNNIEIVIEMITKASADSGSI
jgi:very-short-patch-repair endonuclease